MNLFARKFVRSPHLLEVFGCYGTGVLYMTMSYYHLSKLELAIYVSIGLAVYTLLEYWFHRVVLHDILNTAHNNHHEHPRNLRIIATPILPVQFYDTLVVFILMYTFGKRVAFGINCGVAIGQIIMDTTHVLFHSNFRPWYLESARSYHLHHHFVKEEVCHGLTTPFWDMVFGTAPSTWIYYKKYPFLRYLQLPFPLLTFVIIGLLTGDQSKTSDSLVKNLKVKQEENASSSHVAHGALRSTNFVVSFSGAVLCMYWWHISNFV